MTSHGFRRCWNGEAQIPRPADYEEPGLALWTHRLHGYDGALPPMALIAPFARVARSTNWSTTFTAITGYQLQNVTAADPGSACRARRERPSE